MKKLINKNLIFTFILLVIFGVGAITPISALAAKKHFGYSYESPAVFYPSLYDSNSNSNSNDEEDSSSSNNNSSNNNYLTNRAPVIYTISPNFGLTGSAGRTIMINGDNFTPSSTARINGSARNTTYVNSSRLAMQLTNSDMANSGVSLVNVANSGGGISNSVNFTLSNGMTSSTTTPKKTTTTTPKKTTAPAKTTPATTETKTSNEVACATAGTDNTGSSNTNLTATANFGAKGFMPQNILQWFLLAVMVFLIVFLVRKIYRKDQKYRLTPLKHS